MANVKINPSSVLSVSGKCDTAKQNIQNARNKVASTNQSLNGQIRQRANIATHLNKVASNLDDIKSRVNSIQSTCNNSAKRYSNTDNDLKRKAQNINNSKLAVFK